MGESAIKTALDAYETLLADCLKRWPASAKAATVLATGIADARNELKRAQGLKGMGEWRPIETAPKDGKAVLIWWRTCHEATIGWWGEDDEREGWRGYDDDCVPRNQQDCTHWMPLPQGPAS